MCGAEMQHSCIPLSWTFGIQLQKPLHWRWGSFPGTTKQNSVKEKTHRLNTGVVWHTQVCCLKMLILFPRSPKFALDLAKIGSDPQVLISHEPESSLPSPSSHRLRKPNLASVLGMFTGTLDGLVGSLLVAGGGRTRTGWQHGDSTDRELQGTAVLTDWRNPPPGTRGKGFFPPHTHQEHFTSPFKSLAFCFAINVLFLRRELRAKLALLQEINREGDN